MTLFQVKVFNLIKQIPKGKITTYKQIGLKLNTKAYKAINLALQKNINTPSTPCHRVINSNGTLGGYQGLKNNPKKYKLLKKEGIEFEEIKNKEIKNFKIKNFKKILYKF